jgi:outer membrane receptor for ferric coprogen and ferric-rhodotorulic acid
MLFCAPVLTFAAAIMPAVQAAEPTTDRYVYAIPAAPLATQLNQFAAQSGIYLASDAQLTAGKSSPALNGTYTLTKAFPDYWPRMGYRQIVKPTAATPCKDP